MKRIGRFPVDVKRETGVDLRFSPLVVLLKKLFYDKSVCQIQGKEE